MTGALTTLEAWLQYLEGLHPVTIEMGLDRVSNVAASLLDLHKLPPVITVTGTNGKGSTVMSVEAIALAHGQSVGTYMSPHLLRYNERVRINGDMVTDAALIESFEAVEKARGDISLTYFEFGTLSALWLFARARLDLLVLEVGLGGRLDAVNIISPCVAVITSIALDHQSWLGDTREQVCFEKAGIRRHHVPLVCGDRHPPSNLFPLCEATHTPVFLLGRDFDVQAVEPPLEINARTAVVAHMPMQGGTLWHVPRSSLLPGNMACALQALHLAGVFALDASRTWAALAALTIPGRRQQLQSSPAVFVDVGHNPHAAVSLSEWIGGALRRDRNGRVIALVGMLSDKDYAGTLAVLVPHVDLWQPVTLDGLRGLSGEMLAQLLRQQGASVLPAESSPLEGLSKILEQASNNDTIIAFGSFYTVSDLLAHYASGAHGN